MAAERKGHGSKARGHLAAFPPPTRLELIGTTSEDFQVRWSHHAGSLAGCALPCGRQKPCVLLPPGSEISEQACS